MRPSQQKIEAMNHRELRDGCVKGVKVLPQCRKSDGDAVACVRIDVVHDE